MRDKRKRRYKFEEVRRIERALKPENGWTLGRKARQALLIQQWKPWEQLTGPKSDAGEARSAMRGYEGVARQGLRELRQVMREADKAMKVFG